MDTSDPDIRFDIEGFCNHCNKYHDRSESILPTLEDRDSQRDAVVRRIKSAGRGREYDCIIGVSGGVDSSYLAYQVKQLGLRPLAVHFDNGWNSELAVTNIQRLLNKLDIDLVTYVVDWDEFRELQLSFLQASTPDTEIPTDHAIMAVLWKAARKHRISYVIGGSSYATESIMPRAWSRGHKDWKYIKSVHRKFSGKPLRTFPKLGLSEMACYKKLLGLKTVSLLNYLPYDKSEAMELLQKKLDWTYYGGKHYESIFTRFYQGYILPTKFGFDKRRCHNSNLICSGQMTREQALAQMRDEVYPPRLLVEDRAFVLKKLGLDEASFQQIMALPRKSFWDYPSYEKGWLMKGWRNWRSGEKHVGSLLADGSFPSTSSPSSRVGKAA